MITDFENFNFKIIKTVITIQKNLGLKRLLRKKK